MHVYKKSNSNTEKKKIPFLTGPRPQVPIGSLLHPEALTITFLYASPSFLGFSP